MLIHGCLSHVLMSCKISMIFYLWCEFMMKMSLWLIFMHIFWIYYAKVHKLVSYSWSWWCCYKKISNFFDVCLMLLFLIFFIAVLHVAALIYWLWFGLASIIRPMVHHQKGWLDCKIRSRPKFHTGSFFIMIPVIMQFKILYNVFDLCDILTIF